MKPPTEGRSAAPSPNAARQQVHHPGLPGLEDLRDRLCKRIDELVSYLFPHAQFRGHEWQVGSILGAEGNDCVIGRDRANAGLWYDRSSAGLIRSGDVLDMITLNLDLSPTEAFEWAFDFLAWREDAKEDPNARVYTPLPQKAASTAAPAGLENLKRLKSKLRRCQPAVDYLHDLGLTDVTIEHFHLGLREPYKSKSSGLTVTDALACPVISPDGRPAGRYCMHNLPGITTNPPGPISWCSGRPLTYWSGRASVKESLVVAENYLDLWLLYQHTRLAPLAGTTVLISSSHWAETPREWVRPDFWSTWRRVYLAHGRTEAGEHAARALARICGREVRRLRPPEGAENWATYFKGVSPADESILRLVSDAPAVSEPAPLTGSEQCPHEGTVGDFVARPININGAYVGGQLYYPFTVEHRSLEGAKGKGGPEGLQPVMSYKTKVVRSDGAVLDVVLLPAPRGTPRERRVLALTDGTRIEREPQISHHSTWHLDSIQGFIEAVSRGRPAPHRPLRELLVAAEAHLRRSAWLPNEEDYTLLSFYAALSFVYQVFPAIPLVMVSGEKGTGKSTLGEAIAGISFNAVILGQGTAASVIRLINETRGLVVLDDVEALSRALEKDFGDISQMLKLSYKKVTGRKALTLAGGKTAVFDFYGPKVINNTQGVDDILGSRMLHVETRRVPELIRKRDGIGGADPEEILNLRNEFHVWGMANARSVECVHKRLAANITDRMFEMATPLRALAELADDQRLSAGLEAALVRQSRRRVASKSPTEALREAVNNCIRQGAHKLLSSVHLDLELHMVSKRLGNTLPNLCGRGEWVGHQLRASGIRDTTKPVSRARLYGRLTRIYTLNDDYVNGALKGVPVGGDKTLQGVETSPPMQHPFDFCTRIQNCESCMYYALCPSAIPGLMSAKAKGKKE